MKICNKIDHYYKKSHFLSFFPSNPFWYLYKKELKSSSIIPTVWLPVIISMLSLSVFIVQVSSESSVKTKLIAITNWIFHLPWFLWLSITSFRYGSVLSRYLSLFPLVYIHCNWCEKHYQFLLVYNNPLYLIQVGFICRLIVYHLCFFFFSNLKRFFYVA